MMDIQRKSIKVSSAFYHWFAVRGRDGWVMPRNIRKLIAGSKIHRAWFLGYNHFFEEDGVWYGLGRSYGEMLDQDYREFSAAYQKAQEEEIKQIEAEGCKYYTDDELRQSQWDDYYEDTGMAQFARDQEEAERKEKLEEEIRIEILRKDKLDAEEHAKIIAQDSIDISREYNS